MLLRAPWSSSIDLEVFFEGLPNYGFVVVSAAYAAAELGGEPGAEVGVFEWEDLGFVDEVEEGCGEGDNAGGRVCFGGVFSGFAPEELRETYFAV